MTTPEKNTAERRPEISVFVDIFYCIILEIDILEGEEIFAHIQYFYGVFPELQVLTHILLHLHTLQVVLEFKYCSSENPICTCLFFPSFFSISPPVCSQIELLLTRLLPVLCASLHPCCSAKTLGLKASRES